MERTVIHLNIADFSVAVERLLDRTLQHKPLIIAPPVSRAQVYDMSEEAYQDGVRKGMQLNGARKRCPQALVLPPQPAQYQKVLAKCMRFASTFTPLVEPSIGNGHLYLDVTGTHRLFGPPPDIGWQLRKILRRDLGLDPIWSVAPNKLVAKVASRLVKPCGEYIVSEGEEQAFLAPLPLVLLPGVATDDLVRLRELNISRVHQAAALSVQDLSIVCGPRARFVYHAVRGLDNAPVRSSANPPACHSFSHAFAPDSNNETAVRAALAGLATKAGRGLRSRGLGCRKIGVQLTYADAKIVARQATAKKPVADDRSLDRLAAAALYRAWQRRVGISHITLSCSQCARPVQQLSLFNIGGIKKDKNKEISFAFDAIHKRYGPGKVQHGVQYNHALTLASQ